MNQSIEEGYDSRFNISKDGRSLYITDLTSDDEGYYQVLIWHPAGYKNKTTYLKVESPTESIVLYNELKMYILMISRYYCSIII